jgi:transcription antitermination factor NusG
MEFMQQKWYAVYTRPRWEKKVSESLKKMKIVNYCPLMKVQRQWSDRKKIIHEPLFTSYVFVQIDESQQLPIRSTSGVINFVYWLGKPAVIRNEEITTIRHFLNDYENVKLEKTQVNVNDTVRVLGGPLMEKNGQVVSVKNNVVKVMLPSLGYMMYVEVKTSNIEIINHSSSFVNTNLSGTPKNKLPF